MNRYRRNLRVQTRLGSRNFLSGPSSAGGRRPSHRYAYTRISNMAKIDPWLEKPPFRMVRGCAWSLGLVSPAGWPPGEVRLRPDPRAHQSPGLAARGWWRGLDSNQRTLTRA